MMTASMQSSDKQNFKPRKISYFGKASVIHLVDFPIFYIECLSERHFIIAGGGGRSKTGVHNQINILELVPTGDSCAADLIMKFHTPEEIPDAIMTGSLVCNLPIVNARLVTGGEHATIYNFQFDSKLKIFSIEGYNILRDKQISSVVKRVKCCPGKILTGGVDGQLAIWEVSKNSHKFVQQIKAHSEEIDEVDVDSENGLIVTLSRNEGVCTVWALTILKPIHRFQKDFINNNQNCKYNYRSCRFAYDSTKTSLEGKKRESHLLIACNPIPKTGPSMLYKISTNDFTKLKATSISMDGIMVMTVSSDGKQVAIGLGSGSVQVFETKKFTRVYSVVAHHNAVTSLEFLVPTPESLNLTNSKSCALLSVSIDRRVVLHRPNEGTLLSGIIRILVMVIIMYLFFAFLQNSFGK